ncbi:hypothetical protein BpHYR1_006013 [Brachionus plicatilis]|uniref:Uncharacterized protein n=1 Tax=Brachionus plicatilis TaxID=10195 RepID=A0A3M7QF28_BRAPC|nr:hypothetical protein BpHYR1_006013 [Brachionus plicatilis]
MITECAENNGEGEVTVDSNATETENNYNEQTRADLYVLELKDKLNEVFNCVQTITNSKVEKSKYYYDRNIKPSEYKEESLFEPCMNFEFIFEVRRKDFSKSALLRKIVKCEWNLEKMSLEPNPLSQSNRLSRSTINSGVVEKHSTIQVNRGRKSKTRRLSKPAFISGTLRKICGEARRTYKLLFKIDRRTITNPVDQQDKSLNENCHNLHENQDKPLKLSRNPQVIKRLFQINTWQIKWSIGREILAKVFDLRN